ncbi:phenylacetate--CoA ligase family protein [Neobacillus niacini]|uniref:phenylacetate--CoA ligase family protein n=1 Tax=Neobacillus niacini TaxID=86668 RepID=UPI0021CB00E9|nr:AMP-binding protein [Neobacillus niacini]MCM3766197.1 AMP-binding protein [Neobacillus niacini]
MDHTQLIQSEIGKMNAKEVIEFQNQKFLNQIAYVLKNSAFYQKKFTDQNLSVNDIKSIDDLTKIPFTEKQELRDALLQQPPRLGANQAASDVSLVRIHSSSGTTGRPTYVGLTKQDAELWDQTIGRALSIAGIGPTDVVAHCWNYSMFVGGLANHLGGETTGATMIPIGIGQSNRLVRMIKELGITAITGTPSYILYLANVVRKELGVEPAALGIKTIITGGEPGGGVPATRELIESTWNAECHEVMGMVDIHPMIGAECQHKQGMHFTVPDLVLTELIDVDTGEMLPIATGVIGEAVYTHLERYANPILRFRSHDMIEILGTECECGHNGYRYRVVGRTDDMLIVKGVNVYPSAVEDVLRSIDQLTGEFAILLEKEGVQQDYLNIVAEYANSVDSSEIETLKKEVEKKIAEILLFKANIDLVEPNTLPRFEHKAKRVYKTFLGENITK